MAPGEEVRAGTRDENGREGGGEGGKEGGREEGREGGRTRGGSTEEKEGAWQCPGSTPREERVRIFFINNIRCPAQEDNEEDGSWRPWRGEGTGKREPPSSFEKESLPPDFDETVATLLALSRQGLHLYTLPRIHLLFFTLFSPFLFC
jgi:hypothetical protein